MTVVDMRFSILQGQKRQAASTNSIRQRTKEGRESCTPSLLHALVV
jgi:hypothetical protein